MSEKGQNFLQRYTSFMQKNTPFKSFADAALLGATDFDKKGRNKDQTSGLSAAFRRGIAGTADAFTDNQYDFDKKGSNVKIEADKIKEMNKELGDPYNRDQYNRDFRNMLITDSALREYEAGREAKRNLASAKQYFQMASIGQESAARRRLMEDQFSPTKISQQKLRAQQGEAVLMNAIANQGNTAVNISTAGLSPRGRAGGR